MASTLVASTPVASLIASLAALVVITSTAFASGSGGGFGQDNGYQARVDRLYETGKSVYYARDASGDTVSYCIDNGGQTERVSLRVLKPFKGTSADQLGASLMRCDAVTGPASEHLDQSELDAVVYYLNKRYQLALYQS